MTLTDRRNDWLLFPWQQGAGDDSIASTVLRGLSIDPNCVLFVRCPDLYWPDDLQPICQFNTAAECETQAYLHNLGLARRMPDQRRQALVSAARALRSWSSCSQARDALREVEAVLKTWPGPL